jgi:hypothetical protein
MSVPDRSDSDGGDDQERDHGREWQLRALRGEVISDAAYSTVKAARALADDGRLDEEARRALRIGDNAHLDDARRFERLERSWEMPSDFEADQETTAQLEERIARRANGAGNGDTPSLLDRMRSALLDPDALEALPPPVPLVAGWLNLDSLAMVYGPSGAGKTFLGLDLALHVVTGSWWHGNEVTARPVMYVIAEGVAGTPKRVKVWREHHQVYRLGDHQPIRWLPQAVNLTDMMAVAAIAELCAELQPGLVVFDTLARCALGAEENSAKDMGKVVASLDHVRRVTGACVLLVHHSGKDASLGSRGSTALRGAMDTELELTTGEGRVTLKCSKQKDGAPPPPLRLALIPRDDTCILVPAGRVQPSEDLSRGAAATLETLREIQVPGGIAAGAWEAATEASRRAFYTHRARLLHLGLVRNAGTERQPRYLAVDDDEET